VFLKLAVGIGVFALEEFRAEQQTDVIRMIVIQIDLRQELLLRAYV